MAEEDPIGEFVTRGARPAPWAVAAFVAACAFAGAALLLLILSWT